MSEQVRPVCGDMEDEIVTVPVKPLTAVRETVDEPADPALTGTEVGLATKVKS